MMAFGAAKKPKLTRASGTVAAIVMILLTSAVIRLATGADVVLANIADTNLPAEPTAVNDNILDAPRDDELDAMLKAFLEREERIRQQEAYIEQRMQRLREVDAQIELRLNELEEAEQQLRRTVAFASTAAEDDLERLTAVYENMKPKTAAALFQEMAPEFAAGFLGRMRPDAAADVMAGMTPEAAYTVSAILAGRNANAPTE